MTSTPWIALLVLAAFLPADQEQAEVAKPAAPPKPAPPAVYVVPAGTRVPLTLINSISTKSAAVGDRVYLESAFPILENSHIVIPPGSYVSGTVTQVKRAGKVKGRAELFVRFDSLTLPNGVTRDFRATVSAIDGSNSETLDREEGKVIGDSNKSGDAVKVGEAAGWGSVVGGVAAGSGMGAGIGAAAGAAAGLIGVLVTRGPDAVLERGSTVEMILDRTLKYAPDEVDFGSAAPGRRGGSPAQEAQKASGWSGSRRPY